MTARLNVPIYFINPPAGYSIVEPIDNVSYTIRYYDSDDRYFEVSDGYVRAGVRQFQWKFIRVNNNGVICYKIQCMLSNLFMHRRGDHFELSEEFDLFNFIKNNDGFICIINSTDPDVRKLSIDNQFNGLRINSVFSLAFKYTIRPSEKLHLSDPIHIESKEGTPVTHTTTKAIKNISAQNQVFVHTSKESEERRVTNMKTQESLQEWRIQINQTLEQGFKLFGGFRIESKFEYSINQKNVTQIEESDVKTIQLDSVDNFTLAPGQCRNTVTTRTKQTKEDIYKINLLDIDENVVGDYRQSFKHEIEKIETVINDTG
jgi:hypothetical protein